MSDPQFKREELEVEQSEAELPPVTLRHDDGEVFVEEELLERPEASMTEEVPGNEDPHGYQSQPSFSARPAGDAPYNSAGGARGDFRPRNFPPQRTYPPSRDQPPAYQGERSFDKPYVRQPERGGRDSGPVGGGGSWGPQADQRRQDDFRGRGSGAGFAPRSPPQQHSSRDFSGGGHYSPRASQQFSSTQGYVADSIVTARGRSPPRAQTSQRFDDRSSGYEQTRDQQSGFRRQEYPSQSSDSNSRYDAPRVDMKRAGPPGSQGDFIPPKRQRSAPKPMHSDSLPQQSNDFERGPVRGNGGNQGGRRRSLDRGL